MSRIFALAILLFFIYIVPLRNLFAQEQQCEKLQSTAEQSDCLGRKLQKAEADMNLALKNALSSYLPSATRDQEPLKLPKSELEDQRRWERRMARSLQESQAKWLAYRESACSAIQNMYEGGTIIAVAVPACKLELTEQRMTWLQSYFDDDFKAKAASRSGESCPK